MARVPMQTANTAAGKAKAVYRWHVSLRGVLDSVEAKGAGCPKICSEDDAMAARLFTLAQCSFSHLGAQKPFACGRGRRFRMLTSLQ